MESSAGRRATTIDGITASGRRQRSCCRRDGARVTLITKFALVTLPVLLFALLLQTTGSRSLELSDSAEASELLDLGNKPDQVDDDAASRSDDLPPAPDDASDEPLASTTSAPASSRSDDEALDDGETRASSLDSDTTDSPPPVDDYSDYDDNGKATSPTKAPVASTAAPTGAGRGSELKADEDGGDEEEGGASTTAKPPVSSDTTIAAAGSRSDTADLEERSALDGDDADEDSGAAAGAAAASRSGGDDGNEVGDFDKQEEQAKNSTGGKSRKDFSPEDWLNMFSNMKPKELNANPDSGVQKGSQTELPSIASGEESSSGSSKDSRSETGSGGDKPNRLGVVAHSDDPKAKAETPPKSSDDKSGDDKKESDDTADEQSTTTAAPKSRADELDAGESRIDGDDAQEEVEDAAKGGKSRAGLPSSSLGRVFGPPTAAGETGVAANRSQSAATNSIEMLKSTKRQMKLQQVDEKRSNALRGNMSESIERLGKTSGQLESKKNTSIIINGRKFDQVEPVECVDPKFYEILMKDLNLVVPSRSQDYYGTYYDPDYAKAIGALIDAPTSPSGNGIEHAEGKLIVKDILREVRELWGETKRVYNERRQQLDMKSLPVGLSRGGAQLGVRPSRQRRAADTPTANFEPQPRHQAALANYRYLLSRLERLKLVLLNGEEALIVMNNKVRKLNQAVGETELQKALCSCITSRSGRAAFSLMNELFVDKNSAQLMRQIEEARRRGDEAAVDTAEFCAYWYGDTIRSEAVQKEKQIKRLVLAVARERQMHGVKINKTKVIKETKTTRRADGTVLKETRTRVVTTLIEMTDLWLPKLATWIRATLDLGGSEPSQTLARNSTANSTAGGDNDDDDNNNNSSSADPKTGSRRRRSALDAGGFSTPFDNPGNYADVDDPVQLESSAILQSHILNNYPLGRRRRRRAAPESWQNVDGGDKIGKTIAKLRATGGKLVPTDNGDATPQPAKRIFKTTRAPRTTTTSAPEPTREPNFEARISESSNKCAVEGFTELLSVAYDQNALMYESNVIAKEDPYIVAFRDAFISKFARRWREKRDAWSKSLDKNGSGGDKNAGRSVDEEIDDSFEAHGGSYERGARLGFTLGKFIGEKSANQWPDPAELNTFTYDSLFLAGIGHDYAEEDSKQLERRIVAETAKRVAFSESNRLAFAKTLHSAYLNGAFIVPTWGVLHAQRAVAKQAAKEGGKAGFEAASKAAAEFMPKASKFFQMHRQQRQLAAPYKAEKRTSDKWAGLSDEINEVQLESELNRNISNAAIDCGQKSGTLMGALMGLVVAPEAFETYTRFRGSLEALESEFNQYKLGAMRAYELGETWALLNYTATMNKNLREMKTRMGSKPTSPPAPELKTDDDSSSSTTTKEESSSSTSTSSNATISTRSGNSTSLASFARKTEKETSKSLFESKSGSGQKESASGNDSNSTTYDDDSSNTNNVFQYMVLNYGTHLVANHSRKHMLKIRSMYIDENLLLDMKTQAGDLIADPQAQAAQTLQATTDSTPASQSGASTFDDSFDSMEPNAYAGELRGEFNSLADGKKKKPIKFNIIDLGPVLVFADELKKQVAGSGNTNSSQLDETPLTSDLAKIGKVFMKFSVARRKRKNQLGGPDEVARYLNGNSKFDQGDGYMCGTFNQLTSHLANGSTTVQDANHTALVDDDFSMEATILDELFERIERTPGEMGTVSLVERVFGGVTTMAPAKVEVIAERTTTTTSTPTTTTTTTTKPASGSNSTEPAGAQQPGNGSRGAFDSLANDYYQAGDEDSMASEY